MIPLKPNLPYFSSQNQTGQLGKKNELNKAICDAVSTTGDLSMDTDCTMAA